MKSSKIWTISHCTSNGGTGILICEYILIHNLLCSSDVKFNDTIEIRFGNKIVEVRVAELKEFTRKEDADKMYEMISETRITEEVE